MKRFLTGMILLICLVSGQTMIVRVYAQSRQDLARISPKCGIDIAAVRPGKWFDIAADNQVLGQIIASGLTYEVIIQNLESERDRYRANYLSYNEVNDSLQALVQNYPAICKLDSLPIPTYEGNWVYGIKISDLPHMEEDDEAGLLIDGVHHAREWACPVVVLFFADSMLRAYGVDPEITDIINTTEIYCFPIVNVDGYLYDYSGQFLWRKNREPFGGSIGNDPNRNYQGCSGDLIGDWGAVDNYKASHSPSSLGFCGARVLSGDETRALSMYAKTHNINAYMTYHSYGEVFVWPWGWTALGPPDSLLMAEKGNYMGGLIQRLGGGTYDPGQSGPLYGWTSGESEDWFCGYNHYVNGIPCFAYCTEVGTEFYQPEGDLDFICHENFKALNYLAGFADSIVLLCDGVVPPPVIYPLNSVNPDFTLAWHPKNTTYNHPLQWELIEFSDPSITEDDLESGSSRWILEGFTLSTAQAHSGTYSLFSGNIVDMNSAARTFHPYLVEPGDSLTFWCQYTLEYNYDVAVAEVSENTKEWYCLDDRYTGNSGGWIRKAYSLDTWAGKSVYFRFRAMTDYSYVQGGFYVDDISPVCLFQSIDTVSTAIADTTYSFTNHQYGVYYYYVKGYNNACAWGDYSCLEDVTVATGIAEQPRDKPAALHDGQVPTVFKGSLQLPMGRQCRIFDITGRAVVPSQIKPGIYFIEVDGKVTQKVIKVR